MPIDELDGRLIELFAAEPRVGVLEASRRLGVARGTVQARLDRLARDGVIAGHGPEIDPAALGYGVTAFVTLQLRQAGGHDPVAARLAQVPEVIEAHTITGPGDMLCRIVARSNTDLQRVIDVIVDVAGVERASSVISSPPRSRTAPSPSSARCPHPPGADRPVDVRGGRAAHATTAGREPPGGRRLRGVEPGGYAPP